MSRHHFRTTHENRPVTIVLGWDRPLRGYFCTVEREDAGEEEEEFVYCNLDDEELISGRGFSAAVGYFETLLAELGLSIPEAMIAEVERDGELNTGNRHVFYDAQGAMTSEAR